MQEQQPLLKIKFLLGYNMKTVFSGEIDLWCGESTGGKEQFFGRWGNFPPIPTNKKNPVEGGSQQLRRVNIDR